eukprot:jgi/Galph1/2576/GphlegSOOS_G1271.1
MHHSYTYSEETAYPLTKVEVSKQVPYESWWRDDSDSEQTVFKSKLVYESATIKIDKQNEEKQPSLLDTHQKESQSNKLHTLMAEKANSKKEILVSLPVDSQKEPSKKRSYSILKTTGSNESLLCQLHWNHTKVLNVLQKFIKQHKVQSLVQARCNCSGDTKEFIEYLVSRHPKLHFLGVHPETEKIKACRHQMHTNALIEFAAKDVMKEVPIGFQLMWNLEGIHDQSYESILRFFIELKKKKYRYVGFLNIPNVSNERVVRKGTYIPVNVRAKPFSFPTPLWTVNQIGYDSQGHCLELLFYQVVQLPNMASDAYLKVFLSWIG